MVHYTVRKRKPPTLSLVCPRFEWGPFTARQESLALDLDRPDTRQQTASLTAMIANPVNLGLRRNARHAWAKSQPAFKRL